MKNKKNRLVYYLLNNSTESPEYKIIINKKSDSIIYELYRIGNEWTDDSKDGPCCVIEDHGNGINTDSNVASEMDYHQFHELYLLCKFIFSYDKTIGDKYTIL